MNARDKILLIEDDSKISEMIFEILGEDYDITLAINCKDAKKEILTNKYDLILSDIQLPDGLALNVMKQIILEKKESEETPILFMTGNSDREFIKDALKIGAVGFVDKPFSLDKMKKTVLKSIAMNSARTDHYKNLLRVSL